MSKLPKKIFISYSQRDEQLKNNFIEFLQPLVFSGKISIWDDRAIGVGELWDDAIKRALEEADIVIFLISPPFLANIYVNEVEIAGAMRLRKQGKSLVPVILRPSAIDDHIIPGEEYKLADFQGVPTRRKPVVEWKSEDEAWMDVVKGLSHLWL